MSISARGPKALRRCRLKTQLLAVARAEAFAGGEIENCGKGHLPSACFALQIGL